MQLKRATQTELETPPTAQSVHSPFAKKYLGSFQTHRTLTPARQLDIPSKATSACCQLCRLPELSHVCPFPKSSACKKRCFFIRRTELADGRSRRSQEATALCPLFPGDSLRRAGRHASQGCSMLRSLTGDTVAKVGLPSIFGVLYPPSKG